MASTIMLGHHLPNLKESIIIKYNLINVDSMQNTNAYLQLGIIKHMMEMYALATISSSKNLFAPRPGL
jgi:hypothetical protein